MESHETLTFLLFFFCCLNTFHPFTFSLSFLFFVFHHPEGNFSTLFVHAGFLSFFCCSSLHILYTFRRLLLQKYIQNDTFQQQKKKERNIYTCSIHTVSQIKSEAQHNPTYENPFNRLLTSSACKLIQRKKHYYSCNMSSSSSTSTEKVERQFIHMSIKCC